MHSLKGLPHVIDLRNIGLVAGIELEPIAGKPAARAFDVFLKCYERGLLVRTTGDIIALSPPLVIEQAPDRRAVRHARRRAEGGRLMLIGVPKEIKTHEYRVGLVPGSVRELAHHGHSVIVERGAGAGIGFDDAAYEAAGARIAPTRRRGVRRRRADRQGEGAAAAGIAPRCRPGQVLFTYLHLAADQAQAGGAAARAAPTCIAYETVTDARGGLPLLAPMSEVAGRMAIQVGAHCLEKEQGGLGILLGGVPGVAAAKVVILGGGVAGTNAARVAMGMEAYVTVIDKIAAAALRARHAIRLAAPHALRHAGEHRARGAGRPISSSARCWCAGAAAPKLVTRAMVQQMKPGSVLVDISIDQGGCFETSRPTTHADPTYVEEGVIHYCVTNMPGAVARTSTFALNNATLPFIDGARRQGLARRARRRPASARRASTSTPAASPMPPSPAPSASSRSPPRMR